jgi:hypothetical protein
MKVSSKIPSNTRIVSKEEILAAMKATKSNQAAARYIGCNYYHYRKYAKLYTELETGKSLFEAHKNQSGLGIPVYRKNKGINLERVLRGEVDISNFSPQKLKHKLISTNILQERCYNCGFNESRVIDNRIPLILNFKDNNKKNWKSDNIQFLCYNCTFLYYKSPVTEKQIEAMEDHVVKLNKPAKVWEVSDEFQDHLKHLDLKSEDITNEFVDYIK